MATAKVDIGTGNIRAAGALLPSQDEPNVRYKMTAFGEQSRPPADDPRDVLRRFLQFLRLRNASAAERSLLRSDDSGRTVFHWKARRYASTLGRSHLVAQRSPLAADLDAERRRREQAEAAERASRQALIFKDVVIQEVHHRTKNTLQIAASLLSLHAHTTSSSEVRLALQESYGRLLLLANVHQLLYANSDGTQEISMPTLLHAIGDALRQSFADMSGRVKLRITCDQIMLVPDTAIPMALLANEVVTNAYKHAFPGGSAGEIVVNLTCAPGSEVILQIADNGVGMRADSRGSGLGQKLIHSFAAQLQGTLTFPASAAAAGTVVTLKVHGLVKRRPQPDRDAVDVACRCKPPLRRPKRVCMGRLAVSRHRRGS